MLAGKRHRRPVSRVLSDGRACARSLDADTLARTVISLGVRSPVPSSSLPAASWSRRATSRRLFGLAPAGVYPATPVARRAVRSYRTISTLPDPTLSRGPSAVSFLWHCPSHPRDESRGCAQALPGSLPCGARTFLDRHLSRGPCRDRPAGDVARRNIAGSDVDRSPHRRGDERAARGAIRAIAARSEGLITGVRLGRNVRLAPVVLSAEPRTTLRADASPSAERVPDA